MRNPIQVSLWRGVFLFCMAMLMGMGTDVWAQDHPWSEPHPNFKFGGSLRVRGEVWDDFRFSEDLPGSDDEFVLTQLRLHLLWVPEEALRVYIEGQDARVIGEDAHFGLREENTVPSIFTDEFDLHQGYVDLKPDLFETPVRLRVGRQKLNLGAQRLVSSLEWVNTARVWDAARITVGGPERSLDLFSSRLVAVDFGEFNDWAKTGNRMFDSDFHGLYYTDKELLENTTLEAYYLLRHESDRNDEVHTIGGRFAHTCAAWDFDGELAGQFGDYNDMDHEAFMVHVGAGYTFEELNNMRAGVAYNFGSGDDDAGDDDHETFDNLYPLNHAYYGYMDYFALQNVHNAEASVKGNVLENLNVRLAYQGFWLAEEEDDAWYNAGAAPLRNAGGANASSYVGSEVDLTLKYKLPKIPTIEGGYSHFFAGDYVGDTGPSDDSDFFYLQTKLVF